MEYGKITMEDRVLCAEAREREEIRDRKKKFIRSTFLFVLRKLLLLGSVAAAAVIGAFMFEALEAPNELQLCNHQAPIYTKAEDDQAIKLLVMSMSYHSYSDFVLEDFMLEVRSQLRNFSRNVVLRLQYDGRNCSMMGQPGGEPYAWNFYGSLLFSTTVMTTIGYGNIAPLTAWGRMVTIVYAMISIPLMLLCLSSIGDVMAQTFRFIYINFCCLVCCRRAAARRRRARLQPDTPAPLDHPSRTAAVAPAPLAQGETAWSKTHPPYTQPHATAHEEKEENDNDDLIMVDDDDEDEDYDDIPIPITVVLLVEFIYVAIGAFLFIKWEGWSVIKSFYYCFVTLSTIGFGDIIPGTVLSNGLQPSDEPLKLFVVCIYMLIGLAFISMAFDLIQHEINSKILNKDQHNDRWQDNQADNEEDEEEDTERVKKKD